MSALYQLINIFIIALMLGVPVIITVLLLRHFGKSSPRDELIQRIVKLEKRVEELERELMDI